jgi:hypothetical protein
MAHNWNYTFDGALEEAARRAAKYQRDYYLAQRTGASGRWYIYTYTTYAFSRMALPARCMVSPDGNVRYFRGIKHDRPAPGDNEA